MKNALESTGNRADHIRELTNSKTEIQKSGGWRQRTETFIKNEETLWELFDFTRKPNIIIGIPEEEEKGEKAADSIFKEIKAENFSNLEKKLDL